MALLEFRNVAKTFGGMTAIRDMSFEVENGEIVGLIGPNGAGKTTLFSIASGFLKPTRGSVHFDGESIDRAVPWGVDTFDSCYPTRVARHGYCLTRQGACAHARAIARSHTRHDCDK